MKIRAIELDAADSSCSAVDVAISNNILTSHVRFESLMMVRAVKDHGSLSMSADTFAWADSHK